MQNDLYVLSAKDLSATLLETTGDVPYSRTGHACALLSDIFVVWGGDSDSPATREELSREVSMLDLLSRVWTCVRVFGTCPVARCGHTLTALGSKLYMFGGSDQKDVFDDTWTLDFASLRTSPSSGWEVIEPSGGSLRPSKRTNHSNVLADNKIIIFGGTDLQQNHNDTWEFDTVNRIWTELNCFGPIPAPREGHSATVVDGMMYVFGGRGLDGRDLGDTWALSLAQRRWYTFRRMDLAPSARSGHGMVSHDAKIFVFGGLGKPPARTNSERETVYVLDTALLHPSSTSGAAPVESSSGAQSVARESSEPETISISSAQAENGPVVSSGYSNVSSANAEAGSEADKETFRRDVQVFNSDNSSTPIRDFVEKGRLGAGLQVQDPNGTRSSLTQLGASQHPSYPWSRRRLLLLPPATVSKLGVTPPTSPSPSPFPRYGHSLPVNATSSAELFLFGGLSRRTMRNDLYLISGRDLSATLLQTTGEIPSPRVGHASALVGSVLIVWGGHTKTSGKSKFTGEQDDSLYLLNLVTREWTRVAVYGPSPVGRYGHAVTMVSSKFYVFGGQVDGNFLNDLWSFDLNSLRTKATWELVEPVEGSPRPPKRTSHTCVTYGEKIILFGGTDCQYHYNDTWAFDTTANTWTELACIGFIPSPREGHSAAVVDDVMYVFGGRYVDGKDLGELGALDLSNQRWYMFQNMGPAPCPRSGHAMASMGSQVFVLGGESMDSEEPEDPTLVHVLNTEPIRFPNSKKPTPRAQCE
ncbi:hypothetical protein ONZ51_g9130 [Trametes cubensis]|uniref:Galactose oxidase n=1 Tax=Trametes cubensis TaxID=1111947 RepID=A0AAD7TLX8_9APHY|nr:hypothetical protein ONZ51_g9130 [Trametes cubensis]